MSAEIDQTVRNSLNFIAAENIDTVLEAALNQKYDMGGVLIPDISHNLSRNHKRDIRQ